MAGASLRTAGRSVIPSVPDRTRCSSRWTKRTASSATPPPMVRRRPLLSTPRPDPAFDRLRPRQARGYPDTRPARNRLGISRKKTTPRSATQRVRCKAGRRMTRGARLDATALRSTEDRMQRRDCRSGPRSPLSTQAWTSGRSGRGLSTFSDKAQLDVARIEGEELHRRVRSPITSKRSAVGMFSHVMHNCPASDI